MFPCVQNIPESKWQKSFPTCNLCRVQGTGWYASATSRKVSTAPRHRSSAVERWPFSIAGSLFKRFGSCCSILFHVLQSWYKPSSNRVYKSFQKCIHSTIIAKQHLTPISRTFLATQHQRNGIHCWDGPHQGIWPPTCQRTNRIIQIAQGFIVTKQKKKWQKLLVMKALALSWMLPIALERSANTHRIPRQIWIKGDSTYHLSQFIDLPSSSKLRMH